MSANIVDFSRIRKRVCVYFDVELKSGDVLKGGGGKGMKEAPCLGLVGMGLRRDVRGSCPDRSDELRARLVEGVLGGGVEAVGCGGVRGVVAFCEGAYAAGGAEGGDDRGEDADDDLEDEFDSFFLVVHGVVCAED